LLSRAEVKDTMSEEVGSGILLANVVDLSSAVSLCCQHPGQAEMKVAVHNDERKD